MNELDSYASARQRADQLAPVEEVVGPQVADEIGTMREAEAAIKGSENTRSVWDYVTAPISVGLDLMHGFSSRFRGLLAKKKFEPASGSDLTGLSDEVITPEMQKEILHGAWYHQAFPALMMPKRVVNLFAEMATDPFMLMGGAGLATKVTKASKPGESGASAVVPKKPEATQGSAPQESGVAPAPKATPEGSPAAKPEAPPAFKERLLAKQLEEADNLKLPIEVAPRVVLEPGAENAQKFLNGFGSGRELRIEDVKGIQLKIQNAPEAKKPGTQLSLSPHAERMPSGTEKISTKSEPVKAGEVSGKQITLDMAPEVQKPGQMSLPGIGRPQVEMERMGLTNTEKGFGFKRNKDGVWEMVAKGSTRFEKLEGKQLRLALTETVDLSDKLIRMRKHIDEATLSDPQMTAVARKLLDDRVVNVWSVIKKKQEAVPEQAVVAAESAVNRAVVEDVDRAIKAWKSDPTNEDLKEKVVTELAFFFDVNKKIRAGEAERAAALRAAKTGQDPAVQSFQDFFAKMADGTTLERAVYALEQMKTVKEKETFLKNMTGVGPVKGTILQHMLNGLISSTGTPVWNFAAGTSLFGAKVFERWRMEGFKDAGIAKGGAGVMAWAFTKSYIDLIVAASKMGKNLTESQAGAVSRLKEGMDTAKQVFTDKTGEELGKLNLRRAISARNYGKEDSWYGPAIDYYGHLVNIPSFMVGTSDAFLKFAVRQAAMEARAFDEAAAEVAAQMKMGKQINKADAGKLVDLRRQELMKQPDKTMLPHPETGEMVSLSETGDEMANLMSMMTQLRSGTLGQKLDAATHNSLIGRAIVPFFRVQYLSAREALIRTPILARMAPSVKADLEAGGYRAAKAHAQMSTGYALATVGASLAAMGFLEGDGPTDPEDAKMWRLSHTPGTLGFPGDKEGRIPYTRLGPIGQVLRFMANSTEYLTRLPDSEMGPELVNGVAATLASLVADPSFNRDMNDLFAALSTKDKTSLDRWVEHKVTMPLPYSALLRQVNKQIAGETQVADGIFEKAKMLIPGYNGITYYNELGQREPVPMDSPWDGMANNLGFSNKANLDPVSKEVLSQLDTDRVTFNGPTRVHNGVKMTMQEFMDLRKTFGETKIGGRTLMEGLQKLVNSPIYKRGLPGPGRSRQTMVSATVRAYHEKAFMEFLTKKNEQGGFEHEDFRAQYFQAKKNEFELEKIGAVE